MRCIALLVALCALTAAHARDAPDATTHALQIARVAVEQEDTPTLEVQLSDAFVARAKAEAAHKLPYSNPFTGTCMPDEMKVSIGGIPGGA